MDSAEAEVDMRARRLGVSFVVSVALAACSGSSGSGTTESPSPTDPSGSGDGSSGDGGGGGSSGGSADAGAGGDASHPGDAGKGGDSGAVAAGVGPCAGCTANKCLPQLQACAGSQACTNALVDFNNCFGAQTDGTNGTCGATFAKADSASSALWKCDESKCPGECGVK
jgi:hypothetical protein